VAGLEKTFAQIVADLDPPMLIVTTVDRGEPAGCLVGFATQCSIQPARFLVCLSQTNHTTRVAANARCLAVHVVPAGAAPLAELFGGETEDGTDKFARARWHPGPEGLPILEECGRWFAGWIIERLRAGDHIVHVLEVFAAEHDHGSRAYRYGQARSLRPGHEA
jgi:flavin reductase (DIM6/NTAB) family NADH-FMN oxidoreductase RutF